MLLLNNEFCRLLISDMFLIDTNSIKDMEQNLGSEI